jgi:hypothetical protein
MQETNNNDQINKNLMMVMKQETRDEARAWH